MTNKEKSKKNVTPGLVKSEGFTKPRKNKTINPTLKAMVEDLPTTQKLETYSQYYEVKMADTNWIPPQDQLNITEEMKLPEKEVKQKAVDNKQPAEKKVEKFTKPKIKEDIVIKDAPKIADKLTSDMELALQHVQALNRQKEEIKNIDIEVAENVELEQPVEEQKTNVFEEINKNTAPAEETKKSDDKEKLVKEKPYMRVDRTEIRVSVNENNEKVYMVGKNVYNSKEFEEYLQGIGGKVLAFECKSLEIKGVEYKLKGEIYKSSNGEEFSADDIIDLLALEK